MAFNGDPQTPVRVAIQPYVNTPTCNRQLSNQVIPSSLIAGTSQFPGLFRAAIYCLPDTSWQFAVKNLDGALTATTTVALRGRQFHSCSPCASQEVRSRAQFLQWFHPYWIGPKDASSPSLSGPEVTLAAQASQEITFPIPSSADFLMFGMLDDSTSEAGEPALFAQIRHNDSQKGLVDLSGVIPPAGSSQLGISWRDFMAIPSATVTGIQGGRINAYGVAPNVGGLSHLVPRNTQVIIRFTNLNAAAPITLRVALFGMLIYGEQPANRQTLVDGQANAERIAQGKEFLRRMGLTTPFDGGSQ